MTTTQVQHTISRTADTTPVWPTPSDDRGWQDPATVQRLAHPHIHPVAQPGCDLCPPVGCRCGTAGCPDLFEHSRMHAAAEVTAWEMAA
ncbi:hypothetical protein [Micromonospora wenchangensis]|uniref:hypothetical protein n=1 Tax=Micromonospora wenchangensis TaxID=1185415 RepID=UPI00380D65C7